MRNEIGLLVEHADAARQRVARAADLGERAADPDCAVVLAVRAAQDLHQRRLPGAVLAEEHVHLAAIEREIHAVERHDARECLADALHLQDWGVLVPGARGCHCRWSASGGPGRYCSSSMNAALNRIASADPARVEKRIASGRPADAGSGTAPLKQPLRTMRNSGTPRSESNHRGPPLPSGALT